jgi:hypothetical protein
MAIGLSVVLGGAATLARQQTPPRLPETRPGYPAEVHVWVENRGSDQAVPVHVVAETAVPVRVEGRPSVDVGDSQPLRVEAIRQPWEYRQVLIDPARDAAAGLNQAGDDGWEAVTSFPAGDRIAVVMKRPKPVR